MKLAARECQEQAVFYVGERRHWAFRDLKLVASIPTRLLSLLYCQAWAGRVRWVARVRLASLVPLRSAWGIQSTLNRFLAQRSVVASPRSDRRCDAPAPVACLRNADGPHGHSAHGPSAHGRNAPLSERFRTVAAARVNCGSRGGTPLFAERRTAPHQQWFHKVACVKTRKPRSPQLGRNRERNQCHPPGVLSFVRQVATNAVYRPTFTGRLARLLWGKSNGGMGLGQDHWKKASPGPRRLPCDASRNAEPHCAAQSAHRELRKIGCLGTGRAKGRCGGRSRIARPWNCRQRLKFTRLIFFDIRGDVRKAFSVGSTCRMNASQPQK